MSKDILTLAREAGFMKTVQGGAEVSMASMDCLERFAELVRADEREKYKWDIHSCGPTCKRYACVATREAVEAENEACAKAADLVAREIDDTNGTATYIGAVIRARRKK